MSGNSVKLNGRSYAMKCTYLTKITNLNLNGQI